MTTKNYIIYYCCLHQHCQQVPKYISGKLLRSTDSTPVVQAIVVPRGLFVGTISSYNGEFNIAIDTSHKQLVIKKWGIILIHSK